jgi:hypothetical protein
MAFSPAYEETSPHNRIIVAAAKATFPHSEACEEKAGLSLTRRPADESVR